MKIVAFDTEAEALAFLRLEWIAKVKLLVASGEIAEDASKKLITDVSKLSDDQIANLVILGYVEENLRIDNGYTIAYGSVRKAEAAEKWYTRKPEQGLVDLTGYTVIDLPPEWEPDFYE